MQILTLDNGVEHQQKTKRLVLVMVETWITNEKESVKNVEVVL
jgi:hypothetical protein